jgi:hypothetical protein
MWKLDNFIKDLETLGSVQKVGDWAKDEYLNKEKINIPNPLN